MVGRIEVVRSDIRRRDLRLIIAAIDGYANRIFAEEGVAALPGAVGQCGLGSCKRVPRELSAQADLFASSLQEFLCQQLPPDGWNVALGGRIGFCIRGKHRSSAVLRATAGDAPVSLRKSCVLLIYRAPSAVGDIPPWLLHAREERLIDQSNLPSSTYSQNQQNLSPSNGRESQDDGAQSCGASETGGESPARSDSTKLGGGETELLENRLDLPNSEEKKIEESESTPNEIELIKVKKSGVAMKINSFVVIPSPPPQLKSSTPSTTTAVCPSVIAEWGFLQLSVQTQTRKLMETFERVAEKYGDSGSDNIQQLAQMLKDELMVMSGPLWHVFVGREDVRIKTGGVPIAQFTADWIMPKGSPTSGKLRIVGFQLCAPSVVNNFWDRILSAAPYAATAFLCLMWMLKSRLCEDQNDNRAQSRYQQALSERLCGHQGLEVTTALLFCILIATALAKVVRRLM